MLRAIDHVQIAIPPGEEDAARPFYRDLLGLTEVPKTGVQATRGGCWFESGAIKVHLGVEEPFRANKKAHVAFVVDDVSGLGERAKAAGFETKSDDDIAGYERIFIYDPFGNRLEFLKPAARRAGVHDPAMRRGGLWSPHERWFVKRWYGFVPRTRQAALIVMTLGASMVGMIVLSFRLADEGHTRWAMAAAAPVVLLIFFYNALRLGRTDW
jgi:catechol 2,3-dioxygenase-like lactoylglutathione lyase family enzyme